MAQEKMKPTGTRDQKIRQLPAENHRDFKVDFSVRGSDIDEEKRTVELSFSSDAPVEMWFGTEILEHTSDAIRLDRINDGAPHLMDHNWKDQIGVVEKAWLANDGKCRAVVRFSRSSRAQEIFQDVIDGIRTKISVGYRIYKWLLEETGDDGDVYRAVDWEPFEISIVSVPADTTVGVGRSAPGEDGARLIPVETKSKTKGKVMDEDENEVGQEGRSADKKSAAPQKRDAEVSFKDAQKQERQRITQIESLGKEHGVSDDMVRNAVNSEMSLDEFRGKVLEDIKKRAADPTNTTLKPIGMSDKEKRQYNLFAAIEASRTGKWDKAGLELDVSRAIAEENGREARGFFVNHEALSHIAGRALRQAPQSGSRISKTAGSGAELIDTELMGVIELLRNKALATRLGVRMLTGLVGDLDFPKQTGAANFYWVADDTDPAGSDLSLGMVKMVPKTIAGYVPLTRKMLLQPSIDAQAFVLGDMLAGIGLGVDNAVFAGSGVGEEPLGVINQTGIGAVDLTGGPTWSKIVEFETDVSAANADVSSMSYVCNASMRGTLKTTEIAAGHPLHLWHDNQMNGYPAEMSNQIPAGEILFGAWDQVMLGLWGTMDVVIDEAAKAASGGLVVRMFQDADVAVRHASSFSRGQ